MSNCQQPAQNRSMMMGKIFWVTMTGKYTGNKLIWRERVISKHEISVNEHSQHSTHAV